MGGLTCLTRLLSASFPAYHHSLRRPSNRATRWLLTASAPGGVRPAVSCGKYAGLHNMRAAVAWYKTPARRSAGGAHGGWDCRRRAPRLELRDIVARDSEGRGARSLADEIVAIAWPDRCGNGPKGGGHGFTHYLVPPRFLDATIAVPILTFRSGSGDHVTEPTGSDTGPHAVADVTPLGGRQTSLLGPGTYSFGLQ
jgi:hypothetical protein